MPHNRPAGADLFSGVGGFSLGFEQAGFDVIAAVDVEKTHVDAYRKNFPTCSATCMDLSSTSASELRKKTGLGNRQLDVIWAGPPCQGFSLIGKRDRKDPRNLLLYDLARLLIEMSPSYFVVENVSGILQGKAQNILGEFVRRVEQGGYVVVKPIRELNAAEFGVPQLRRRVFVLGYKRGMTAPAYPNPQHWFGVDGHIDCPTVWDAIGDLSSIRSLKSRLQTGDYHGELGEPSVYAKVLKGEISDPQDKSLKRSTNGSGLTGCLLTEHTPKTVRRFRKTPQGSSEEVSRYHRLAKKGLAPTLRAGTGPAQGSFMAARPIHPSQARCITVREAARLHSFPDWFHFDATKWHGFRQVGNSVPPRLARAVAESIRRALENTD
jgi:DNA (cytosine-5)-methyltransferase 1